MGKKPKAVFSFPSNKHSLETLFSRGLLGCGVSPLRLFAASVFQAPQEGGGRERELLSSPGGNAFPAARGALSPAWKGGSVG